MHVLISVASRHGSSAGIADTIAETLVDAGFEVAVVPPAEVTTVAPYDGVVIGSAIYAGHWLRDVRELIERFRLQLMERPVWLFSSGPLGDDAARPSGDGADATAAVEATLARGHRVFAGRMSRDDLNLGEKVIASVVHAPEGDFRQWDDIRAWATEIAETLKRPVPVID